MTRSTAVLATLFAICSTGLLLAAPSAPAGGSARTLRMKAAEGVAARPRGTLRLRAHRGQSYLFGRFARLAPETAHVLRLDGAGDDVAQFMSDRRGRARIRHVALAKGAVAGASTISLLEEDGDPVLEGDMHASHGDHHEGGASGDGSECPMGSMHGDDAMCPEECHDHCTDGGDCDAQCHADHGCGDACCCSGDGAMEQHNEGSGMHGGADEGAGHDAHHGGSGGDMHGGASGGMHGGGGMMGGSGHGGGGMMKR